MPKNTGRGGRNYRRGPHKTQIKRELVLKEEGTVYGQVTKMLGSGRVEVYCFDCVKRLGNIRGKMKRRVWIGVGDVVLISLREFQN
jgi:translation initiation factor 1A